MKLALEESVEGAFVRRNTVVEQLRADPARERPLGQGIGNRAREFVAARRWSQGSEEGELACVVHSLDASLFRSTHCGHRRAQEHSSTEVEEQLSQQHRKDPLGLEEYSEGVDERRDPGLVAAEEEVDRKRRIVVLAELRRG